MRFKNIPDKMKRYSNWLVWKLEDTGRDKPTKVPYCARTNRCAKVNDPQTWCSFDDAQNALQNGIYSGIGFVFTNTPFIGIDIDGCISRDSGEISKEAQDAFNTLRSYTEISQSGTGFHMILEGQLPSGRRRNGSFEMYGDGSGRYFAMTGDIWGEYAEIRADQEAIDIIHQKYIETSQNDIPAARGCAQAILSPVGLSDEEIIKRASSAKNGDKFTRLWRGGTSDYDDDNSRADLALCGILAFWCACDFQQMDRLFRQSGLMRPKWDEVHGKETYGAMTIYEAIRNCREVYHGSNPIISTEASANTPEWEPPIPFAHMRIPEFPIRNLPTPMVEFASALSETAQTPTEMAGILSLGVLAAAFQSHYTLQFNSDWKEPLCLYTVAVAPPADRKSKVFGELTAPIYVYEEQRQNEGREEVAKNHAERAALEAELRSVESRIGKANENDNECRKKIKDLKVALDLFEDKYLYQVLVDDVTQEKLIDTMEKQKGCITVASAEGGIFDMMVGRYNGSTSIDVYLKGHSDDPISVGRMKRKENKILHPRLSMILTVQPEVLNGLMGNKTFRGRGLCGRFLYAICRSKVGSRNVAPETIPEKTREAYKKFITHIFSQNASGIIQFSDEAKGQFRAYMEEIEKRLGNEWESMGDWGGKLAGATLRIAALIHAAETLDDASKQPVSSGTMNRAIEISECLCVHAEKAYQLMNADIGKANAEYLWKRIQSLDADAFSQSRLFDICKGKFRMVEDMEPALNLLVEMNYIKIHEAKTGKRGRPGKVITVNPLAQK